MADINKLLGQLLNSGAATGLAGGLAGGLATGMMSKKTKKKIGKTALKAGGIAAVGALAFTAYKQYNKHQGNDGGTTPPSTKTPAKDLELFSAPQDSAFIPALENQQANDELALTLVRAMIAASNADGVMDSKESQVIFEKISELGLDSENQALLVREMNQSVDINTIVKSATSPEVAAEIYTASLLAIDVDNAAERGYLAMLAARLELPQSLVQEIEQLVADQKAL